MNSYVDWHSIRTAEQDNIKYHNRQSTPHPTKIGLRLGLPGGLFPQVSPPKPCMHLFFSPYGLHVLPVSFFLVLLLEQYLVRSTNHEGPRCAISFPPFTSSLLGPDIYRSPLLPDTFSLHSSVSARHQVSHPYKKGEVYRRTGRESQEGEKRYSCTLSLTSAQGGGGWSTTRLGRFTAGEETGAHFTRGWVRPKAGLEGCGCLPSPGIRFPDHPARSESLYRLHPYKTRGKIIILYILIFILPDSKREDERFWTDR